jgi:two-component system, NarL family, invasion response regulator UvrY
MKNLTIGLANDHAQLQQGFAGLLRTLGHTVLIQAANGLDLLQQLRNTKNIPQVCIVDLHMPIMNGFELAKRIKEEFNSMKVIVFSMSGSKAEIEEILACGADRYVYKGEYEALEEVLLSYC